MINADDHEQILADPKATTYELRSIIAELQQENTMKGIPLAAYAVKNSTDLLAAITPGGIEAQEAAGQVAFVRNTTLPKDCDRKALVECGVIFCTDADDLFVNVVLPNGWKKQATSHSMHSDLLDEKGRVRAMIFYKAAFYDRRANMRMCSRYNIDDHVACDADGNDVKYGKHTHFKTVVTDGATVIHVIGMREAADYMAGDIYYREAQAWLDENYHDWRNPLAYW